MTKAISVEGISKRYLIKHQNQGGYLTLRDSLTNSIKTIGKNVTGDRSNTSSEDFWALKDVSFDVKQGDRVGIIGRNGAGKSTLLKILSRITEPTSGRITMKGRIASLLEVGTGFHPELTGRENIYLNGAILGMSKVEIKRKFDEIVEFSEVEKFLDTPVKRYSSGMYVRLAFAVAAHLEPDILIVDEVLAVGDAQFQKKCLGKMESVSKDGRTILFVSHNMGAIKSLCPQAIVLQNGTKYYEGDVLSAVAKYDKRQIKDTAVVRWDLEDAPTTSCARLIEVGILSNEKQVGADISTESAIQIYIEFEVMKEAKVGTSVLLYNSEGQLIFASMSNHEPDWHMKERPKGRYRSFCEIPANFLADGDYMVSIPLWEGFYENGIVEKDVLQFRAHEKGLVRGDYPHPQRGNLTQPLLKWTSKYIEQ